MTLRNAPLFSEMFESVEGFRPPAGSTYISGVSGEKRSRHTETWLSSDDFFRIRIVDQGREAFSADIDGQVVKVPLRSQKQLASFWNSCRGTAFVDMTGLSHHIWAPLLRSGLENTIHIIFTYVEPAEYRFSPAPTEGAIFDLSDTIEGVAPIPGFAWLRNDSKVSLLVALLGFEGTRFAHLVEHVQPSAENIIPIVGLPGFRPEYPFYTFHGNRYPLAENHAWKQVRYAIANCPFSLAYLLDDLAKTNPEAQLRVAPIGTKPHSLGAVMFAIKRKNVEILYDYPIRKAKRTEGTGRLLLYHVSDFLQDW